MTQVFGPTVAPKPMSIVKAISAVKREIKVLAKANDNQHGDYKYTSGDQVYAAVVGLMADNDYVIDVLEAEDPKIWQTQNKKGDPVQWMRIKFLFVHSTPEDTWTDPRCSRSLALPMTGPQTFMAAQTYTEKTYLRSLFKIPTGDVDVDQMRPDGTFKQERGESKANQLPDVSHKSKRQIKAGTEWADFESQVNDCDDLTTLLDLERQAHAAFPNDWQMSIDEIISRKKSTLMNGFQA